MTQIGSTIWPIMPLTQSINLKDNIISILIRPTSDSELPLSIPELDESEITNFIGYFRSYQPFKISLQFLNLLTSSKNI